MILVWLSCEILVVVLFTLVVVPQTEHTTRYVKSVRPPRSRGSLHSRVTEVSLSWLTMERGAEGGPGVGGAQVRGHTQSAISSEQP